MTQSASLIIEYDNCAEGAQECSGRIFIVDPSEYTPGTTISFCVYGVTSAMISGLSLWNGNKTMGMGKTYNFPEQIEEIVSFDGEAKKQLQYPIAGSYRLSAQTDIMGKASGTGRRSFFASRGAGLNGIMKKVGYSCIATNDDSEIYGSVNVAYARAPYFKEWRWTVPSKAGDYWFFLCDGDKMLIAEKLTVDAEEVSTSGPQEVTIVVREYTSEALVAGALVTVDGRTMGTTDENGTINVGRMAVGLHTLKITKEGYVSSEFDDLENDSFIIE